MYRRTVIAFASSLLLAAAAHVHAGEVERWNRVATNAAAAEQMDPLNESRVFAIVHAAIHNALNAIERRYESYRGVAVTVPTRVSSEAAVAAAAHACLVELVPGQKANLDATLRESLLRLDDKDAATAGVRVGQQVASALLELRRSDGASRSVKHPAGKKAGEYRPTPPDFTPALFAQWGEIRPFVLAKSAQFRPAPPPVPGSERAQSEIKEVSAIGGQASALRTAEQSEIARFWYESSPQGWNRIARVVAAERNLGEWETARLFALVNLAMADGFIGGFEAKYHYNYWRPATPITQTEPAWLPELGTPPVPDYPSTHTVLGAAAAAALARFFGTDMVSFSMTSGAPYAGITRHFWSFSEAAHENGASRVFAGIHFASAVRAGYEQGERIGAWTYERALRPVRAY